MFDKTTGKLLKNGIFTMLHVKMMISGTCLIRSFVTGFRRLIFKPTACLACLMLDGEYYKVESDFSDHPRGKCTTIPVTICGKSAQWQTGMDWLQEQDEDTSAESCERPDIIYGKIRAFCWKNWLGINLIRFLEVSQHYGVYQIFHCRRLYLMLE